MIKHKLIPSFLPVFNGFYSTIFEASEDQVIESQYTYDDYEFDYSGYGKAVAIACVNQIEKQLPEYGINGVSIKFDKISSPKEYNFYNDSIWVRYRLTSEAVKNVNDYLLKNKEAFATYVKKNYTSCSGFWSSYSNEVSVWFNEYLTTKDKLDHCFGAVLEFIFENEGYTSFNLYEDTCDKFYLDGWLKEGIANVDTDIESYSKENYLNKDAVTIACELVGIFENDGREFDWLTYGYVETKVNEYFNSVAKHTLTLKFN